MNDTGGIRTVRAERKHSYDVDLRSTMNEEYAVSLHSVERPRSLQSVVK